MRMSFAIVLLSAFVGIAMFSIFAMNHDAHTGCIAKVMAAAPCPSANNPFAMLSYHLDALRNFSSATFASSVISVFFLVFAAGYGFLHGPQLTFFPRQLSFSFAERPLFLRERILHWFSLHENSPGDR